MNWKPISESELKSVLDEALAALSPQQQKQYRAHAVMPRKVMCSRTNSSELDPVFVIADGKGKIIFYDDVEDEFAVAPCSAEHIGPSTDWKLFTDLGSALAEMLA